MKRDISKRLVSHKAHRPVVFTDHFCDPAATEIDYLVILSLALFVLHIVYIQRLREASNISVNM